MTSLVGVELELDVGAIAHGGHWAARHDGQVVFVRHALEGERVVARVTKGKVGDRFLFADAVSVLNASPHRVAPPCPHAGPGGCGGCDFQHVALPEQRRLKAQVLAEQLSRLAGLEVQVEVEPLPGETDGLGWRTRMDLAVDRRGRPGLRPRHSHAVLAVPQCRIAGPQLLATGAFTGRFPRAGEVSLVASSTGERAVVVAPHGLPGTPTIHEDVAVGDWSARFALNARSFWQAHPRAAATYVERVLAALDPQPGQRALDLYAGVGLFAVALADRVGLDGAVLAVESDRRAAAAAQANAAERPQLEVRAERVEVALAPLLAGGDRVDLVVLDPPRAGAGRQVTTDVLALRPARVAYVACDPAALARDLATAIAAGYRLASLTAYDAFPMTHHVEAIALLTPADA